MNSGDRNYHREGQLVELRANRYNRNNKIRLYPPVKKQIPTIVRLSGFSVRLKGLEPTLLSEPDPKSGAATNYATAAYSAHCRCKDTSFFGTAKLNLKFVV